MDAGTSVFATPPREAPDIKDCAFYHITELPGVGTVGQEWDLRNNIDAYLGNVSFAGKRVLEVGTASGFICFHMERLQADVIAHDLSPDYEWDIVPMQQYDYRELVAAFKNNIRKLNNGFWFAHHALNSKARVVHSPVYSIPHEIGEVDIATFCDILVHLQNPFMALKRALSLTREKVIVTDLHSHLLRPCEDTTLKSLSGQLVRRLLRQHPEPPAPSPYMVFLPDFRSMSHKTDWWILSPEVIVQMLGVLGFEKTCVTYHKQKFHDGHDVPHFTVVGERTRPLDKRY